MKLLICTQIVDRKDPMLGFFVRWIEELSQKFEQVSVICLQKGEYTLPPNVRVYSLGKERGVPPLRKLAYMLRFFSALRQTKGDYDAVFVHMNQEYILLSGMFWKLSGKKVYFWRNHYDGSFLTDIAALFCDKIFYTSKFSYTAKYKKAAQMPVGTDADFSKPLSFDNRKERSVLSIGRISPSKNIDLILKAWGALAYKGVQFEADIIGATAPEDEGYRDSLIEQSHELGLEERVRFHGPVPKDQTYVAYQSHEVFINASPSGMLDKTIFSAAGNGCLPLVSSRDFAETVDERFIFDEGSAESLAQKLEALLTLPPEEKRRYAAEVRSSLQEHSIEKLALRLAKELQS